MTSSEKFDILQELDARGARVKLTTVVGEELRCRLIGLAEDEADWAYRVVTLDEPERHYIIECGYIVKIEELVDSE